MSSLTSEYTKTNISFSGCDMVATISIPTIGDPVIKVLGTLQTLSYSTHMDKKPIRTLGRISPVGFVNGPRTIAGSLVFAVFNQHFLKDLYAGTEDYSKYAKYILSDELPPFDLTISMANEYGARSRMAIYGVTLVNEGKTISVNDVYTENTYQFMAADIEYLEEEGFSQDFLPIKKVGKQIDDPELEDPEKTEQESLDGEDREEPE